MAGAGNSALPPSTSEPRSDKKRRISSREGIHAFETAFDFNISNTDLVYFNQKLESEQPLIPFLASWLRDGVIQKAWAKQQAQEAASW